MAISTKLKDIILARREGFCVLYLLLLNSNNLAAPDCATGYAQWFPFQVRGVVKCPL